MEKKPATVPAALLLIRANALFWMGFAALTAANASPGLPSSPQIRGIMAVLAFGFGCALIALSLLLARRSRFAYYALAGLLILTILLTLADEVGWADLAYVLFTAAPLVLLIKDRGWYGSDPKGVKKID